MGHEGVNYVDQAMPSGEYEYRWQGVRKKDHFKTVRHRISFPKKMSLAPSQIELSNIEVLNCSNLQVVNITRGGFTISVTGIKASTNQVYFEWEAKK